MDSLVDRLFSFLNCPDHIILPPTGDLAQAGFWFTGHGDEVECYHCHLRLGHWKPDDIPEQKHFTHRPQCTVAMEAYSKISKDVKNVESNQTRITTGPTKAKKHILPGDVQGHLQKDVLRHNEDNRENCVTNKQPVVIPKYDKGSDTLFGDLQSSTGHLFVQQDACAKTTICQQKISPSVDHEMRRATESVRMEPRISKENTTEAPYEPTFDIYEAKTEQPIATTGTVRNSFVTSTLGLIMDYKVAANRMATFSDWPSNAVITAEEAVQAGLYYIGPADKVRCAWCNGGLFNWDLGDTAMGEHSRYFPQCPFVLQLQADSYPNQNTIDVEGGELPKSNNKLFANNPKVDWHSFNAVQLVLDMGYTEDLVERAVQQYHLNASTLAGELVDVLSEMELNEDEGQTTQKSEPTEYTSPSAVEKGDASPEEQQLSILEDENQRLKSNRTCTVCLETFISVVFLPCRHYVCCQSCSESLKSCPLCRERIVGLKSRGLFLLAITGTSPGNSGPGHLDK